MSGPGGWGRRATADPVGVQIAVTGVALAFLALFVALPLLTVFSSALSGGLGRYLAALAQAETVAAIRLTLLVAAIAVPVNTVFGLAAAWLLARHRFPLKGLLLTLIDLPFSVSPVVAGLLFVLLFGAGGLFERALGGHQVRILFAVPGVVLASLFVTVPFVAREVLPLLEAQGAAEEEAAITLGASGWQMLWYVTLPRVRLALLTGIILCNARAMGEFGAVSVVSGHVRGLTTTLPLEVEILYNEYNFVGAFAAASMLSLLALVTLLLKRWLEPGPLDRRGTPASDAAG